MRPIYIWQYPEWPQFKWNEQELITPLAAVRNLQGQLVGMMRVLGFDMQNETSLEILTQEIVAHGVPRVSNSGGRSTNYELAMD